jgi:hypothetical protein
MDDEVYAAIESGGKDIHGESRSRTQMPPARR